MIIQSLTGDEDNIYVGPEEKILPEAQGQRLHFF